MGRDIGSCISDKIPGGDAVYFSRETMLAIVSQHQHQTTHKKTCNPTHEFLPSPLVDSNLNLSTSTRGCASRFCVFFPPKVVVSAALTRVSLKRAAEDSSAIFREDMFQTKTQTNTGCRVSPQGSRRSKRAKITNPTASRPVLMLDRLVGRL